MIRLNPPAKINLGLRILGRLPDGYHEIRSLVFPLKGLCDVMEIENGRRPGLELHCPQIKGANILHKAYDAFAEASGSKPSLKIKLTKKIPAGAGLGGGSSDAAALLKHLNAASANALAPDKLLETAMKTGADVPFFLSGRPAEMTGAGERLAPIEAKTPPLELVLVWPGISVSTAWAYGAYDSLAAMGGPCEKALTKPQAKATQSCFMDNGAAENIQNDLELPVFRSFPLLGRIKEEFLELGAAAAGMSGSGSAMYGIFRRSADADAAFGRLRNKYDFARRLSI